MEEKTNRLLALEGLRGVAAIMVVIFHVLSIFYPGMIYGMNSGLAAHQNMRFEDNIFGSPLAAFVSGTFAVAIFFVLSGFVLTIGFFQTGNQNIIRKLAAKRYIRLMVPALVSVLIVWLLISFGFNSHKTVAAGVTGSVWLSNLWQVMPNLWGAIQQGAYGIFVNGVSNFNTSYNPVLWTMQYEFIGSFIVFGVSLLFKSSRYRWIFYIALLLATFSNWYFAFVIGMILADLYVHKMFPFNGVNSKLLTIILIPGIILGGYPAFTAPGTLYKTMTVGFLNETQNQSFYLAIGAAIVVIGILAIPTLTKFFSQKHISILGKYTFSLYLVHMAILFTVCTTIFVWLHGPLGFNLAAIVSTLITIPIMIIITFLFEKYVDSPSIKLSGIFSNWFLGLPQKEGTTAYSDHVPFAWFDSLKKFFRIKKTKL